MMDPSEINNFEDQWRKALKEASEAPPQSVWEGIEARLDQEDRGAILPLWWQSSKIWYAAASIAALLLVGGGIWYSNSGLKGNKVNTEIAAAKQNAKESVSPENEPAEAEINADAGREQLALEENKAEKSNTLSKPETVNKPETGIKPGTIVKPEIGDRNQGLAFEKSAQSTADGVSSRVLRSDGKESAPAAGSELAEKRDGNAFVKEQGATLTEPEKSTMALALLPTTPYSDLDIHMQKRYVFFRPEVTTKEEPVAPAKNTEYYAALSLMPASFNPNLKVKEAPVGFSGQSLSTRRAVSGTSEAGASYAVQTQGGMKLSKHWSVEMGVSYLKGNSTYEGGGYVMNAFSNKSANVLENAYAGVAPGFAGMNGDKTADFVNNGALYIDVAKTVSNNYQYLQLPVQAGFTIYPEKKFNASILGGMMANFFLSNELESASGEIITTKASDEIYRSMNWAATTGLRFNYRLSTRWNANLTGSYQKSVTSGFRSNQSLDSRPYLYGISWGMRYSF
ncbi:hypothetical protein [Dyadobacter psychrophilus]|uniref:Outer membrane protein beta-barrel domain-containing protein n=1 Tax=Dyadobacter psychrophilus TaxID=651661 RepID=A0A1T5GRD0_9BACT|nr:hypothetical protein [Dyadobacter psychrophilus]SKC10985.1 Outer membrane protein beta-barrel domain-containing protein [Dyadobacter psychrophilus]